MSNKNNNVKKTTNVDPLNQEEDTLDLLGDGVKRNIAEDPLLKFVQLRWKGMLIVLALIFAGFYGKNVYDSTRQAAREKSADLLIKLQSAFDSIQDKNEEVTKNEKGESDSVSDSQDKYSTVSELISALSQEREPYRSIAYLYQDLLANFAEAKEVKDLKSPAGDTQVGTKGLLIEIGRFVRALEGIDSSNNDNINAAQRELKVLVESADFVSVPALIVLVRSSSEGVEEADDFSKEDLEKLAVNLATRQPEQVELLKAELPEFF